MIPLALLSALLSACDGKDDGECPDRPEQDLELERIARGSGGSTDDSSSLNDVLVFRDRQSLDDWWLSADEDFQPIEADVDFSSQQAVALLTYYSEGETDDGSYLHGVQWADEDEEELVFRVGFRCEGRVDEVHSWNWEVFATPIAPTSACHLPQCVHEWDD